MGLFDWGRESRAELQRKIAEQEKIIEALKGQIDALTNPGSRNPPRQSFRDYFRTHSSSPRAVASVVQPISQGYAATPYRKADFGAGAGGDDDAAA
jgi:hypothetical protein